jgi:hypothetical protein
MPLRTKALLISGGGNDFAGEEDFRTLIRDDCTGADGLEVCWRPGQPQALFDGVEAGYREIIRAARDAGFDGTVFVHAYDYAVPTGRGFNRFIGGWLKQPLDTSRVPPELHRPLVRALVDELETRLRNLQDPDGPIVFIDSTGVLREDEWHDELHPTRAGFDRIAAECWLPAVAPLFERVPMAGRRAKRPTKAKVAVKRAKVAVKRAKAVPKPARPVAKRAQAPAKKKTVAKRTKAPAKKKATVAKRKKAPARRAAPTKKPAAVKRAKAPARRKSAARQAVGKARAQRR